MPYPLPVKERIYQEVNCRWCGNELRDKRRCYCNVECRDNWLNEIYFVEDYDKQRSLALERDNFTCQKCSMTRKEHKTILKQDLHTHHIVYREHGGSNYKDNLLTLCQVCHIKLHQGLW